jgi:hypothetical protein
VTPHERCDSLALSLRANPRAGITTLISAEVNQFTLLIGSMVVIFSLSAGQALSFPLESRQTTEFLLTAGSRQFVSWPAGGIRLGVTGVRVRRWGTHRRNLGAGFPPCRQVGGQHGRSQDPCNSAQG